MYPISTRLGIRARQVLYAHRTNRPRISQAFFQKLCDATWPASNKPTKSELQQIRNARSIYCKSDDLEQFLDAESRSLSAKTIFSGSTDHEFHRPLQVSLGKVERLFLQNSFISDSSRIYTLPIGIENLSLGMHGLPCLLKNAVPWEQKTKKVLVGPFSLTHPERVTVLKFNYDSELVVKVTNQLTPRQNAQLAKQYAFVACVRGNGVDTHRIWEALYRNSLPIVKRDKWSTSLAYLGLPLFMVDDWQELDSVSSEIRQKAPPIDSSQLKPLWTQYWENLVASPPKSSGVT